MQGDGTGKKFNPAEVDKLKRPERLERENPETIWAHLALKEDSCFVDVGAGVGFAAIPFARKMPKGRVYACDLSWEMLEMLEKEAARAGVANVVCVPMGEVAVPLADAIADAALMQNLHHELDRPLESLGECRRLLKKGGWMAVIDWKKEPTPAGPPLHIRVSAEEIAAQFSAAGFMAVETVEAFPYHNFIIGKK